MMFKHILVPLDGTPLAETTLQPAAILAERFGAEAFLLVRSIETWPAGEPVPSDSLTAMFKAEEYLTTVASRFAGRGFTVQRAVIGQKPASGISEEADYHQADLIVMTTRGRQGLDALLHPSVTWEVLRQTSAPILTWKVKEEQGKAPDLAWIPRFLQDASAPLLVPLDGSLLAEQAIPLAQAFAQQLGNPLLLVRAAELPFIAGSAIDYAQMLARAQEWSLAEATSYLERKRLELAGSGLRITIHSHLGDATTIIRDEAQKHQAGLVVMASHGRGGLGRFLVGSVARRLLNQLEIPILLVRTQPAEHSSVEAVEQLDERVC
jgi:nucleotide-binding universal stress UspA family protein